MIEHAGRELRIGVSHSQDFDFEDAEIGIVIFADAAGEADVAVQSSRTIATKKLKFLPQTPIRQLIGCTRSNRGIYALSTSGITSSLLSQIAGSPSTANQFVTDLNQLAKDLQGGNVSKAEDDYVTLSDDAQNGAASSTATTSASGIGTSLLSGIASSSSGSGSFVSELNQLGTDLGNGNLSSAQQDMLGLDSTALNAASSASSATPAAASSATAKNSADTAELIQTIEQGMELGDNSVVGSAMSELASVSPSSQGASFLSQDSESYGGSTGSSSSSSSISQLLSSMNANNSSSSSSGLSLLA
jgi:hypothetical protein